MEKRFGIFLMDGKSRPFATEGLYTIGFSRLNVGEFASPESAAEKIDESDLLLPGSGPYFILPFFRHYKKSGV